MPSTVHDHAHLSSAKAGRRELLPGKLSLPSRRPGAIVRARLETVLDDGVGRGVVLISAPAGTGKTQLVREWCAGRQQTPRAVAWLTLDRADRDQARFLRYVVAAIGATEEGRAALGGLAPLPPFTAVDEMYRTAIQEAMSQLSGEVILVLDDFHEVVGTPTERLMRQIMRFPSGLVRLIVMTRVTPDLGQARLRLSGQLTEIGADDLALTPDETQQMLAAAGVLLGDADLRRVQDLTRGWAAGVQIVGSALARSPDAAGSMKNLPAAGAELDAYLTTEVLGRQPAPLPTFMHAISIVERVCGDLARALTDRSDADVLLAELCAANILTAETHPDGRWYRWSPVIATTLRRRVHDKSVAGEQTLHRRAAYWYRDHALPADAIRHALAGTDTDTAAAVLGAGWLDLVLSGESEVLSDLLSRFPEQAVRAHAELAVATAFTAARCDDLEAALRLSRQAVQLAPGLPPLRRLGAEIMVAVVRLYAATMSGRPADDDAYRTSLGLLDRLADPAAELTRDDRVRRALLRYNVGSFEAARRDYESARRHLRAALIEADVLNLPYLELSCRAKLVDFDVQDGQLGLGQDQGRRVLDAAQTRGWRSYHGLTAAHAGLAAIAILRDDLDTTQRHLEEARRILRPVDRLNRIRLTFLTAATLCASGRVHDAAAEVELLGEQVGDAVDLPDWVSVLAAIAQASEAACKGHPDEGLERLEFVSARDIEATAVRPYPALRGELLIRCGRPDEARDVVAPWTEPDSRRPAHVAALVVDALAAEALDLHQAALSAVDRALAAAAPEGMIQPFVVPGAGVRPLLEALIERGTAHESFAVEVLQHMAHPAAGTGRTSADSPFYVEPLSGRELDVLRLLQGTQGNARIADALCISVNTLRTHMKSINRKLGASDRRDAVRRARDLGLL
jgi:LuxR family maltose regulon positive regulatory protein